MNPTKKSRNKISVGNIATLLVTVALIGQLLGFLRTRLISTNIFQYDKGASDAFFVAFLIPDFFFYTIAAGALGVAFIPILSDRFNAGDRRGMWDITSSLLNSLLLVMTVVCIGIFIFADPLVQLIAPKLHDQHPENFAEAVAIMRIIAFNPLLFTLSGVITSVQQTVGRFFFFAVAPLVYNLCIIASIYLFVDRLGVIGLGYGALIGAFLQLVVALIGMSGLGYKYKPIIKWKNQGYQTVVKNLPARSLDQGIDQVNSIVETNRATELSLGNVSHYNFALTLQNVPIMLIGTSIATAAFPKLTERLSQNRRDLFRKEFLDILRIMIWLAVPTVIISYFCRGYLARLLFGDAAPEVALIFGFLAASIFFRIIYTLISRWFYAQKDTKTPLFISIIAIGLNIFLAFLLARPQGSGGYDIAGLAMAQSIVAVVEVTILSGIMVLRDRKMLDAEFIAAVVKIISVSGFTIVAAYTMVSLLPLNISDRGIFTLGLKLSAIASVTFVVHAGVSWMLGLREIEPVLRKTKKLILRPIRY